MDLVADESVDGQVVHALRAAGHRVAYIPDGMPGLTDPEVLAYAASRDEILLTEDKDFGELVHLKRHAHAGVVLLRLNELATPDRIARVVMVLHHHAQDLRNAFTTVSAVNVRIRRTS